MVRNDDLADNKGAMVRGCQGARVLGARVLGARVLGAKVRGCSLAAAMLITSLSLTACVAKRPMAVPPAQPAHVASAPIVDFARSFIGTPYRYGGATPDSGFDCSGFVMYVMGALDVGMPRTVSEQYRVGSEVRWDRLRDGDLVFFTTTGPGATHVGIVVDAARHQFVHAPNDGSVVRIDSLESDYWRRRWIGTRRVT